jgi:glycosyltransferase involved in cell wall biosynthesis
VAVRAAALRYVAEDAPTGYGDAADRLVRAVRAAGVRVEYRGWSATHAGEAPELRPFTRDEHPRERAEPGAPTVAHLVPEYYPLVRGVLDGGPFVAHTVWETDRIPRHWPELLNATDLVIVPTQWNRQVFVDGGVDARVAVVPHVACEPVAGDRGNSLDLPDDVTVFYSIGRWDERKAMFHTVRAFLDAFTGNDPVMLVVKTGVRIEMPPVEQWGASHPMAWTTGWQVAHLVSGYRNPARIRLETGRWTDEQIAGLHERGDCYVSLARGEGWGIGAFDACAYGNPVIATGWGGPLEYLDDRHACLVRSRLVPVEHVALASYSTDQRWAEPDLRHAVQHMRTVASDLDTARARAAPLRARVLRDYAPASVAKRFIDALSTVS